METRIGKDSMPDVTREGLSRPFTPAEIVEKIDGYPSYSSLIVGAPISDGLRVRFRPPLPGEDVLPGAVASVACFEQFGPPTEIEQSDGHYPKMIWKDKNGNFVRKVEVVKSNTLYESKIVETYPNGVLAYYDCDGWACSANDPYVLTEYF